MTDLRSLLPPPGRTNTTPLFDNHPEDHDAIVAAVNTLADQVGTISTSASYRTYADIATRDADTTAHVEGMLTWAVSERTLALWHGAWVILLEPYRPWSPTSSPKLRLWVGAAEFAPLSVAGYHSGWRHSYGQISFYIASRWGDLGAAVGTDVVSIMPPVLPDGRGPFGTAYITCLNSVGAVGGLGAFNDGTATGDKANPGAEVAGNLSVVMPGIGGLLKASDMAPNGEFDALFSGFYSTSTLS